MRARGQLFFADFRTATIAVLLALPLAGRAESPLSKGMDGEVQPLVQQLLDQPRAKELRCTTCALAYKETPEDVRMHQTFDRLIAIGSPATPALARMLESSLRGSDEDLIHTILWILGDLRGAPWTKQNDISAALPALILALDDSDPTTRSWAANNIGAIGPTAAEAAPKLVPLLDDKKFGWQVVRAGACNGLRGIDPLPTLRQARSNPNPEKRQFAQRAVASIESKCFGADVPGNDPTAQIHEPSPWGPPCDAPPYGDTLAAYKAFAKPYVSISLGPVKRLLRDVCAAKSSPKPHAVLPRWRFGLSDEDIDTLSTVTLVERQLASIVKAPPCQDPQGAVLASRVCSEVEKRHDEPAELFLCFHPDGSCQRIPATPSTPIKTLLECRHLALFLSDGGSAAPLPREGQFVVRGAGAWYECRTETVYDVLKEKLGSVLGL